MGTYTTHYNLFMPTVGEQGWGDLVNGNFTTIDTTMAGLNTRLTAVENEVNGALSCTSVTTSGTITSTGKITANGGLAVTGGITSNLTGNVTGNLKGRYYTTAKYVTGSGEKLVASISAQTLSQNSSGTSSTITVGGYSKFNPTFPYKVTTGIWIESASDISGTNVSLASSGTRTATLYCRRNGTTTSNNSAALYVNGSVVQSVYIKEGGGTHTSTHSVPWGATCYLKQNGYFDEVKLTIPAENMYLTTT